MARNFWRFDKNLGQVPASAQATNALTYMAPGMGVPDGYVASATNVRLSEYRFIQPRLGLTAVSTSGGPTASIRYVFVDRIGGSESIWTVTGTGTLSMWRSNSSISFSDTTADGDPVFCAYNGKVFMAYNSDQNRLHVYDTNESSPAVRRVGLVASSAPTVANTGAGAYAATIRYYKVQFRLYRNADSTQPLIASSELSASTSFTPSGAGTAARVTKPTTVDSATHWVVYASSDNLTFFQLSGALAIATTTYDDSAAVSTYNAGEVAPEAGLFVPPPSAKYLATNGERLIMAGAWETSASSGQTTPSPRRVWFSRPLGATDAGDDESITSTELSRYWLDIDTDDGSEITGLVSTADGAVYVFTQTSMWRLVETGAPDTPFRAERVASGIGINNGYAVTAATTRDGAVSLYFYSRSGPYRYSPSIGLQFLGFDTLGGYASTASWSVGFDPSQNEVVFATSGTSGVTVLNIQIRDKYELGGWSANVYMQAHASASTFRARSFAVYTNRLLIGGTHPDGGDLLATSGATDGYDCSSAYTSSIETLGLVFNGGQNNGSTEEPLVWCHTTTSASFLLFPDFAIDAPDYISDSFTGTFPTARPKWVVRKVEGLVCADAHIVIYNISLPATFPYTDGSDPRYPVDWMIVPYSVKEPL